jgi:hypothetical protein
MTARAVLAELSCVHIVIAVAIDTPRRGFPPLLRWTAVTVSATQIGVSAVQHKAGTQEMIETPA